jgi:hypothetical protein
MKNAARRAEWNLSGRRLVPCGGRDSNPSKLQTYSTDVEADDDAQTDPLRAAGSWYPRPRLAQIYTSSDANTVMSFTFDHEYFLHFSAGLAPVDPAAEPLTELSRRVQYGFATFGILGREKRRWEAAG